MFYHKQLYIASLSHEPGNICCGVKKIYKFVIKKLLREITLDTEAVSSLVPRKRKTDFVVGMRNT
jgi:hypothetical protein